MTFELIGKTLGHSYSKLIHEALGGYKYRLHELPDEAAVAEYLAQRRFTGCNVTIPYKQTVMPLCDTLDDSAARIGAVNTIVNRQGWLTGYNTDYEGFGWMLRRRGVELAGKTVLLLGGGGTAKTVTAYATDNGAKEVLVASRHPAGGHISYEAARAHGGVDIIVNTSPAGMYPNNGESPVDLTDFARLQAVVDVVYNPLKTALVLQAESLGIPAFGGLAMLVGQAVAAARLFTGYPYDEHAAEQALREIYARQVNLVLVGMPSSGKSRLGHAVARKLGKPFVDMDKVLAAQQGRTAADIIVSEGEAAFRQIETEVLREESKQSGRVLSTGGGVVTQPRNLPLLRQNGVVLYLDRPLDKLQTGGNRPLSASHDALAQMYKTRHPLYENASDATVLNDAPFMQVVHRILEAYDEFLDP